MKKYIAFILALTCILGLTACGQKDKTVNIDFNFDVENIENIEMYHYTDTPASAEKKMIIEEDNIKTLYDMFEQLELEEKLLEGAPTGAEVTSFRFNLSDGTDFEIIYVGYGAKRGELKFPTGNFKLFTTADIGWNWRWLNEELEAIPADESELPQ